MESQRLKGPCHFSFRVGRKIEIGEEKITMKQISRLGSVLLLLGVTALGPAGCSKSAPAAQGPPPAGVEVVKVEERNVPIYTEWIGTLDGMVNAEIKAQVTGYLLRRNYIEGNFVRKGQVLFEIDPRPIQATVDQSKGRLAEAEGQLAQANGQLAQAQANLAQAEADQGKAQLDVNRLTPLAREKAVSDQDLDNAVQANLSAKAKVEAARAGIETAKASIVAAKAAIASANAGVATAELNLGFTKILSPVDGVAGLSQAQIGNLVSPSSETLTTVSQLDPVRVYFTPTEQEYLNYSRQNPTQNARDAARERLSLELILVDGTTYPHKGRILAADRNVDQKTGAIRLAGVFPNPGNLLRPGQYGRVRAATSIKENALVVPQRAVTELQGNFRIAVVGKDNKVQIRSVKVGEKVGPDWIIEEGLKPGDIVVAEGTQKIRPDAIVNPKPYAAPSLTAVQ
jgi:RND family efflux transporter MFP subunit